MADRRRHDAKTMDLGAWSSSQKLLSARLANMTSPIRVRAAPDATVSAVALVTEAVGPDHSVLVTSGLDVREIRMLSYSRDVPTSATCWLVLANTDTGVVTVQPSWGVGVGVLGAPERRLRRPASCEFDAASLGQLLAEIPDKCEAVGLTASGTWSDVAPWLEAASGARLLIPSLDRLRPQPLGVPACADAVFPAKLPSLGQ